MLPSSEKTLLLVVAVMIVFIRMAIVLRDLPRPIDLLMPFILLMLDFILLDILPIMLLLIIG